MDQLDLVLSIIDIFLCIIDIGLIIYLFFYKLPHEQKKRFQSRLRTRPNVIKLAQKFHRK